MTNICILGFPWCLQNPKSIIPWRQIAIKPWSLLEVSLANFCTWKWQNKNLSRPHKIKQKISKFRNLLETHKKFSINLATNCLAERSGGYWHCVGVSNTKWVTQFSLCVSPEDILTSWEILHTCVWCCEGYFSRNYSASKQQFVANDARILSTTTKRTWVIKGISQPWLHTHTWYDNTKFSLSLSHTHINYLCPLCQPKQPMIIQTDLLFTHPQKQSIH